MKRSFLTPILLLATLAVAVPATPAGTRTVRRAG